MWTTFHTPVHHVPHGAFPESNEGLPRLSHRTRSGLIQAGGNSTGRHVGQHGDVRPTLCAHNYRKTTLPHRTVCEYRDFSDQEHGSTPSSTSVQVPVNPTSREPWSRRLIILPPELLPNLDPLSEYPEQDSVQNRDCNDAASVQEEELSASEKRRIKLNSEQDTSEVELLAEQVEESRHLASEVDTWHQGPDSAASRRRLEVALALAFVLCNMDKVNLSVAIIPMAADLGWSASTQGLVQASFFWGYSLTQLPAGWLASKIGGERMLKWGVLLWSLASASIPWAAHSSAPAMLAARGLVGLGEGLAPASATDTIARSVPKEGRSRAVSFVFNGFNVGSVAGLVLSPILMEHFGWESVFHCFGALGVLWTVSYSWLRGPNLGQEVQNPQERNSDSELNTRQQTGKRQQSGKSRGQRSKVPWRSILSNTSVRALAAAHFCHDWGKYSLLAWLPTFYTSHLHLSLTQASLAALVPPLGSVAVATYAAGAADRMIAEGVPVTQVRRICQVSAFLAPCAAMGALCALECSQTPTHPLLVMALLSAGLAGSSAALAGLYCSHQDISPKYSSVLLGVSNTAGALPGFVGVALTGYLLDITNSWEVSVFGPTMAVLFLGAGIWIKWVRNSEVDFDALEKGHQSGKLLRTESKSM